MNALRLNAGLVKEYTHENTNPKVFIDHFDVDVVAAIMAFPKVIRHFKVGNCEISVGDHLV
jgi:hypothetical protein